MPEIRAVLTDIGGVVLAVHVDRTLAELASAAGIAPAEVLPLLGPEEVFVGRLYRGEWTIRDVQEHSAEPLRSAVGYEEFARAWIAMLGEDFPEVRAAYEALPQGVLLYTLSNTHELHLEWLRNHWLYELSAGFFASCELGMQKPQPEIFQYALERMSLPGEAVLFFDDNEENVRASAGHGIRGVHVPHPEIVPRTLRRLGIIP